MIYNRPDPFIQELSREGYQLDAIAARVALANRTRIYPPDDLVGAVDIISITFDNDHVLVVDCANSQLAQDTNVWTVAKQLQNFPAMNLIPTNCRPFQATGFGPVYFYARFRR